MRFLPLMFAILWSACGRTQDTIRTLMLGDTAIHVVMHDSGKPGPLYYNMHDDEHTSVDATVGILSQHGGILYELVHTGARNLTFLVDSISYTVDPNRIYTDAGIWREIRREYARDSMELIIDFLDIRDSLMDVGCLPEEEVFHDYVADTTLAPPADPMRLRDSLEIATDSVSPGDSVIVFPFTAVDSVVFGLVRAFSDTLLQMMQVDSQKLLIALHNNREDGYSMSSYRVDSVYEREALSVYVGLHPDPDDFYFVTDRRIFEALQPNHYHIVLQNNAIMTDDGSLSVYCGQRGIQYVNVEAQHRHLDDQKRMIVILLERLGWIEKQAVRSKK